MQLARVRPVACGLQSVKKLGSLESWIKAAAGLRFSVTTIYHHLSPFIIIHHRHHHQYHIITMAWVLGFNWKPWLIPLHPTWLIFMTFGYDPNMDILSFYQIQQVSKTGFSKSNRWDSPKPRKKHWLRNVPAIYLSNSLQFYHSMLPGVAKTGA